MKRKPSKNTKQSWQYYYRITHIPLVILSRFPIVANDLKTSDNFNAWGSSIHKLQRCSSGISESLFRWHGLTLFLLQTGPGVGFLSNQHLFFFGNFLLNSAEDITPSRFQPLEGKTSLQCHIESINSLEIWCTIWLETYSPLASVWEILQGHYQMSLGNFPSDIYQDTLGILPCWGQQRLAMARCLRPHIWKTSRRKDEHRGC